MFIVRHWGLFVILVFINRRVCGSSPKRCILSLDSLHLNCSYRQLSRTIVILNENESKAVANVDFNSNNISEIEALSEWYPNARTFNFEGNSISKIEINTFANLTNLEDINLAYNMLNEILPFTFLHNQHLKHISLSGNKLIGFDQDKPILCSSSLEVLDMSHMDLKIITRNNIMCLPSIKDLNLSYNFLSSLSVYELLPMPQLRTLYLANNNFRCNCQLFELVKWLGNKKSDITENHLCFMEQINERNNLNCSKENSTGSIITQDNIVQEGSVYILYYNISLPVMDEEITCSSNGGIVLNNLVCTTFPFIILALFIVILIVFRFYSARKSADSMYMPIYDTKTDQRLIPVLIGDHTYMQVK